MRKLLLLPVAIPLALAIGPRLAAALWAPAIALLPATAIIALAARKPPLTRLFMANLAVVVAIGFLGVVTSGQLSPRAERRVHDVPRSHRPSASETDLTARPRAR